MDRINIAELLKDCPQGMELDCTMFENVTFVGINYGKQFPIEIKIGGLHSKYLTKEGCFHDTTLLPESKCVIFPKGKTTWGGFQPPFKDGDILSNGICICIYNGNESKDYYGLYVGVGHIDNPKYFIFRTQNSYFTKKNAHLATEEEKEKLFQAIKDNGYWWNAETKTLEKLIEPRFKVGDRVKHKYGKFRDERTITTYGKGGYWTSINDWIDYENQDEWELVPNKFDITTLKSFESRVLVRNESIRTWRPAVFGCYIKEHYDSFYVLGGSSWRYCIPYEGNEHLLGKTDDCDEYYKT